MFEIKAIEFNKEANSEVEEVHANEGECFAILCSLNTTMMIEKESWLRSNIFHMICTFHGKICNVIINGESYKNVVANHRWKNLTSRLNPILNLTNYNG